MTRSEALIEATGLERIDMDRIIDGGCFPVQELVNDIYDDFESRTCDNCKYGENKDTGGNVVYIMRKCKNKESMVFEQYVDNKDGCNNWSKK